nr:hypothetical protein [Saccharothrix variisporea]
MSLSLAALAITPTVPAPLSAASCTSPRMSPLTQPSLQDDE